MKSARRLCVLGALVVADWSGVVQWYVAAVERRGRRVGWKVGFADGMRVEMEYDEM